MLARDAFELSFLYRLKTLAMLHDPPDKCWHVSGKLPYGHEEVAKWIRQRIGVREFEEERFNRLVQVSDILSAGSDRWFSEIYSKVLGSPTRIIRINPLSLEESEVTKPPAGRPEKWAEELKKIFEMIQASDEGEKYKWFYHVLYGFGELLYAELYPESIGPADTRIPHHSIFDHLCATASMVNWLVASGEEIKPQGLMLFLDLAGVQEYIRASKKMSDLRISSLLASYLAWYLVEEVVEKIGPDVLISPTCRMNPFYYRWLLSKLSGLSSDFSSKLREKLDETTFEEKGPSAFALDTPVALLPTKLLLVLPPLSFLAKALSIREEKELAEYFTNRYRDGWSKLVGEIKQQVEGIQGPESQLLKKKLQEAFGEIEKLGVNNIPPFMLRIYFVQIPEDVEKEVEELSKRISDILEEKGVHLKEEKEALFFYQGLVKLRKKERNYKLRGKAVLASNFPQYTQELYRQEKTYSYCTVCSELPAVLHIPRRAGTTLGEECYEDGVPPSYRPFFDEGEHLCPYCLIKRLVSTVAEAKFLQLFLKKEIKQKRVKSVSWYCVYPFLKTLTSEGLRLEDLRQPLENFMREIEKRDDLDEETKKGMIDFLQILKGELGGDGRRPYIGGGKKALLELSRLPPDLFEYLLAVGMSEEILAKVEEKTKSRLPFNPYFSLVQADADNIGKVLSGRIGGILLKSDSEFFATIASKTGVAADVGKYKQIVEELLRVFPSEEGEAIKCWPSLLFAISLGLMATALKDHAEAQKAGPACVDLLYSGGDDLLAVAPITEAIQYVQVTRSTFSMEQTRSFHELWMQGSAITKIPSMGKCTRSYSVVFSHYHAPLAPALENLRKGLDTAKDTEQIGLVKLRKDALFLEYSPRGGAGIQTVVGTRHAQQLIDLLEGLNKGVFSMSLLRDLALLVEKYERFLRGEPQYESLVRYTAERNVPKDEEKKVEAKPLISRLCENLKQEIKRPPLGRGEEKELEESLLAALVRALKIGAVAMRKETI